MLDGLLQFGLGAALIGCFFIPYIRSKDREIGVKDAEISRLNAKNSDDAKLASDQRFSDLKEIILPVVEHLKESKSTDQLILQELLKKNG